MSSGFMGDITAYLNAGNVNAMAAAAASSNDKTSLDMTDFLTLMVTELTSQTIDNTADTSDMLNQLVQMQMIQALTDMTDASIMSYAASLVGKEVTVGYYDANGELQEEIGLVTGTGTYGGEQVIFVNDKYYYMNEIMAVGRLPELQIEETDPEENPEEVPDVEDVETPEETPEEIPEESTGIPESNVNTETESETDAGQSGDDGAV